MTRKQALNSAIKALSTNKDYEETVALLQEIYDELPLNHWSEKSIHDTVKQFIIDNEKVPTATDFKRKDMPSHTIIKQKYNITLKQWLNTYYPTEKINYDMLKEKYTNDFVNEYQKIKPKSQYEFNKNKSQQTKVWQTIASYNNVKSWKDLLKKLHLPLYTEKNTNNIKVNVYHDYDFED